MRTREKCLLWIEAAKKEHIPDQTFDELSYQLAKNYDKLPQWFRNKVPQENLDMGTTFNLDVHKL